MARTFALQFRGVGTPARRGDASLAAALLVLFAPLMLMLAAGVAVSSRGPVTVSRAVEGPDGRALFVTEYRVWRPLAVGEPGRTAPWIGRMMKATGLRRLPRLLDALSGRIPVRVALSV